MTTRAVLRPKEVYCPSCHREMNYGIVSASVICVNENCEMSGKKFAVELPTVDVTLREIES